MKNIELLKRLSLTDYESRTYLALAQLGSSSVREIVDTSKVPRNKVYEALEKLEHKEMIVTIPLSPKQFKIINSNKLRDDILQMQNQTDELIQLIEMPKNKEKEELFHIIKTKKAIENRLAQNNKNIEKEMIGSNNFSSMLYNNIKVFNEAIQRGVDVKIMTPFQEEYLQNYIANMKVGVQIRIFDEKKFGFTLPRMTAFDKKEFRLTIGEPEVTNKEDYLTFWAKSKVYSEMFHYFLEQLWSQCEPIEDYLKRNKINLDKIYKLH